MFAELLFEFQKKLPKSQKKITPDSSLQLPRQNQFHFIFASAVGSWSLETNYLVTIGLYCIFTGMDTQKGYIDLKMSPESPLVQRQTSNQRRRLSFQHTLQPKTQTQTHGVSRMKGLHPDNPTI